MDYKQIIDKLVRELSYRVGIPNIENKEHQSIMSEILSEWGEYDVKEKLFEFLTEKDEKKPEDEKYYNTGGKGYIKMADKAKYDSQGKDFDGETFTKEGPGVYKSIEKGGEDNQDTDNKDAVEKTIGAKSDYAKKEAERQARVADKEEKQNGTSTNTKPLSTEELVSKQQETARLRDAGEAGAGGEAASQGESRYCNAVDTLDYNDYGAENREQISKVVQELKAKKKLST